MKRKNRNLVFSYINNKKAMRNSVFWRSFFISFSTFSTLLHQKNLRNITNIWFKLTRQIFLESRVH